ncbi:toll-like receptor Tollo [Mercenaria mercenaria]|uniref:toll-like receptor Tollo n=1 Tax=Mercenaria mercenaria TaxID=6596 RepID=UPI00234E816A|nr:toll-like receptor Tollo [Mercenaria mercenaria]XP_053397399.1 toll-like receptor Tollo [Mercenaria mercenaria]XP_053397400.1 toll-like receptor Tollo [Mercenaria mercenaria]XP_053397401.1 toll-like receptor Tollo [Mercenaria mercenaria]XP_053397402.1 toll-like receptor Tollo [Mercenaria mercenaria]XP_053397403.1 toll-like receptor Tollo [Mercenaria mercenaria]XP_053397404.1 toll-like receptor Tollo [Mercenaria mercenaria]
MRCSEACMLCVYITMCFYSFYWLQVATSDEFAEVVSAFPPIWHTNYYERIVGGGLCMPDMKPAADPYNYNTNYTGTTTWDKLHPETTLIIIWCSEGFNDQSLENDLQNGYIAKFKLLMHFQYQNCNLRSLSKTIFKGLSRLRVVILSYNKLHFVSTNAFNDLVSLIWLRIDYNELDNITTEHFCYTSKLEFLQLRSNKFDGIRETHNISNGTCANLTFNSLVLSNNAIVESKINYRSFHVNGVLSLTNCSIKKISKESFEGLEHLLDIDLSDNEITNLDENTFDYMRNQLQKISLSNNRLNYLHSDYFRALNISYLMLDHNDIEFLNGSLSHIHNLKVLNISSNKLQSVSGLFQNMTKLTVLNISGNYVQNVTGDEFYLTNGIEKLDFSRNCLLNIPAKLFANLEMLNELWLNSNNITVISNKALSKCTKLSHLYLSKNSLENISLLQLHSDKFIYLNIVDNKLTELPTGYNESIGRCYSYFNLQTLNASRNKIETFQAKCFYSLRNLSLSFNNIEHIPVLSHLPKLNQIDLRGNRIADLAPENVLCSEESSLRKLDIGDNKIEIIATGIFEKCTNLEILLLDNNHLSAMDVQFPVSLKVLHLSRNRFSCECALAPFVDYVKLLKTDNITCSVNGNYVDIKAAGIKPCVSNTLSHVLIESLVPPASFLLLAGIIIVLIFRYRYEIEVIAFYKWNIRFRCCCRKRKSDPMNYKYDVFVCFAEEDVNYVRNTLVPLLEPKFKLCIYYRDFPVGEDIAEAILDVIESSAVTLVVLSQSFIQSRWGTFEFRNAHHHTMRSHDKKLLIIVLENSVLEMKLDLTLRSILYSKAYLTKDDKLFEQKLLHAMPDHASEDQSRINFEVELLIN